MKILVFGTAADLGAPWVASLKSRLAAEFEVVLRDKTPPPARNPKGGFEVAVFVWGTADLNALKSWGNWWAALPEHPRLLAFAGAPIPEVIRALFPAESTVLSSDGIDALMAILKAAGASAPAEASIPFEGVVAMDVDPAPVGELSLSAVDLMNGELPPVVMPPPAANPPTMPMSDELQDALNALDAAVAAPVEAVALDEPAPIEAPLMSVSEDGPPEINLGPLDESAPLELAAATNVGDVKSQWQFSNPEPVAGEGSRAAGEPVGSIWGEGGAMEASVAEEALATSAEVASVSSPTSHAAPNFSLGAGAGGDEFQTLQRYAALKEREAREKDAGIQALNRQLEQIRERLSRSETERRRLTMAMSEAEAVKRSLQDDRDQAKHHATKTDSAHQEELRAMQLRLDNAQFQASRAEKKLEEFRERVRADIQKIRMRERELSNRLELQKRDAEALLAAKDERLLQQKRDIDRLEYENEMLRERLLEQTQKAEDRVARVSRAVKALKMANGMLSGIEDEVLPNANDKDDGEEAA